MVSYVAVEPVVVYLVANAMVMASGRWKWYSAGHAGLSRGYWGRLAPRRLFIRRRAVLLSRHGAMMLLETMCDPADVRLPSATTAVKVPRPPHALAVYFGSSV